MEKLPPAEMLAKFKQDIQTDADVVQDQRRAANEDMRFVNVTGGMWEGFLEGDYSEGRAKLELDMVSDFLQRFIGEWNQNRLGVEFKPDDGNTDDDDAELLNGIYRADFRQFQGKLATDNAVDEAATCGYGAVKLATFFENEGDPENDNQRIEWRPIYNAYNTVFWDRAAQQVDKRDARWCTVLKEYTKESFEEEYPDAIPSSAYEPDTYGDNVRAQRSCIYVATRYEVIKKRESVFVYNNLASEEVETYSKEDHELIADELKADDTREFVRERKITRQYVEKSVFSGDDILEAPKRIAGKWIPIVPVYGFRSYVDGSEWYRGLVRKMKDAARLFNMQVSQLAENAASAGQEVPIFDPEQMEGDAIPALWANKNNKPYLLARALRDSDGNVTNAGPIGYSKPPMLDQSTSALLQIVPTFMQTVAGGVPQDSIDPNASGKAINALIKRANMNTQVVNDNIANAVAWSGEVYQAMAAEVYNTPRMIRTVGRDGNEGRTELFKQVLDAETGRIVEANTLNGKKFHSFADVGPQYDTLREQTVEDLKGMLAAIQGTDANPQYTPAIFAMLMDNITGVGLGPLKDLNRRIMLEQGLVKPDSEEEEQLVARMQQKAQEPDPQQVLIESAAQQQQAEARNLDAASIQKVADAKLKGAKTIETFAGIENQTRQTQMDADKMAQEQQKMLIESLEELPLEAAQ